MTRTLLIITIEHPLKPITTLEHRGRVALDSDRRTHV